MAPIPPRNPVPGHGVRTHGGHCPWRPGPADVVGGLSVTTPPGHAGAPPGGRPPGPAGRSDGASVATEEPTADAGAPGGVAGPTAPGLHPAGRASLVARPVDGSGSHCTTSPCSTRRRCPRSGTCSGGQPRHEAHRHRAAHGSGAMLSWELERALAPRFERVLRSCPNTPWAGSKLQQNRFPLLWRELKRVCRGTRADVLVLASQQREEMGGRRSTPEFTVGTCNPIVGPIGCTMIRSGQRLSASNRRLLVLLDGFIDTRPPPKLQSGYAGVEAHRLNPLTRQQP